MGLDCWARRVGKVGGRGGLKTGACGTPGVPAVSGKPVRGGMSSRHDGANMPTLVIVDEKRLERDEDVSRASVKARFAAICTDCLAARPTK